MRTVETLMRVKRAKDQPVAIKHYENQQPKIMDVLIALVATAILGGIIWICILELILHPELWEFIVISGGVGALVVLVALFANAFGTKNS